MTSAVAPPRLRPEAAELKRGQGYYFGPRPTPEGTFAKTPKLAAAAAFRGGRSANRIGEPRRPDGAKVRYGQGGKPKLMAPSQARELLLEVYRGACDAIAEAGLTPSAAARQTRFPLEVVEDFVGFRRPIGSVALGRLLRVCRVPAAKVTELVALVVALKEGYAGLSVWEPPELDVSDVELRVTTCVELANVLLYLQKKSGLPKLQLAIQAGIPRSQLYNLIDPERFALPRSREQLHAFLRTCSLGEKQTEYVLSQWDQLDQQRHAPATVPPDVVADLPLTPAFHDELRVESAAAEHLELDDWPSFRDTFRRFAGTKFAVGTSLLLLVLGVVMLLTRPWEIPVSGSFVVTLIPSVAVSMGISTLVTSMSTVRARRGNRLPARAGRPHVTSSAPSGQG